MFYFLLFFLFLSFFKCNHEFFLSKHKYIGVQIPVFVDPSVTTTGDGSMAKKFKTLTEALALMSTTSDLLVLLEPNALLPDLVGKIEIPPSQMLTLT